jgi:tagatose-1,6-bisphosphate aldolase non-catalytic subunit AgaZ/GatZ
MEEKYYVIQSGWSGNSMMFWREGRAGYTSNFEKVHKFSLEEAIRTSRSHERIFSWGGLKENITTCINVEVKPEVWNHEIKNNVDVIYNTDQI